MDTPDQPPRMPAQPQPSSQNERLVLEQIVRLIAHYWLPNEDQAMLRAKYEDWLEDLREFPARIVAGACREWRRSATRRPTPADIIRLCREATPRRRPTAPPPPADRAASQPGNTSEERTAQATASLNRYGFHRLPNGLLVWGNAPEPDEPPREYKPLPDDPDLIAQARKRLGISDPQ